MLKLLTLAAAAMIFTATQLSNANPNPEINSSERKLVDPDHVVYHGYQPSGWACDGLYTPNTLIQKIEMGNQLGIHLKKPSSPTFNHFLKCAELVDIYG